MAEFNPPLEWGNYPPNFTLDYKHGPRARVIQPTALWVWLQRNGRRYWTLTAIATVLGTAEDGDIGVAILFAAIALWVGAKVHSDAHTSNQRASNANAATLDRNNKQKAWQAWLASRPMNALANLRHPRAAAVQRLAELNGTVYLGIGTDVHQEFVVGGRRQSVLVLAPTGSGKTLGLAVVTVGLHPGPAVFASTKTDGLRHTATSRSGAGRLWLYDPLESISDVQLAQIASETGTRIFRAYWTPLEGVRDWDSAKMTAKGLIAAARYGPKSTDPNSKHWDLTAEELLAPLLTAAALHPRGSMLVLRRWMRTENVEEPFAILKAVLASTSGRMRLGAQLAIDSLTSRLIDSDARHAGNVWSTAKTVTEAYEFTAPMANAHRQNFDPAAFVRSRDTLYIAGKARTQEMSAPLYVSLIDALYEATTDYDLEAPFEQHDRPPLLMCLDEARNIAPTPYLFRYLSEGLGQGFQMMIFLQSLSQAEAVWGREGRSITDFPSIKVLFGGLSDRDTLEAFSALGGDYDREYVTYSGNRSTTLGTGSNESRTRGMSWSTSAGTSDNESFTVGSSESSSTRKERRFTTADLATLPKGEAVVVDGGQARVVRVGGSLIGQWLTVLHDRSAVIEAHEPADFPRQTLAGLPPIDTSAIATTYDDALVPKPAALPPSTPPQRYTAFDDPNPVVSEADDGDDPIYREFRRKLDGM